MPLTTSTSLSGFIASNPAISQLDSGDMRVHLRVGQAHYIHNDDGSFTQQESTFHDLIMYREIGEKAAAQPDRMVEAFVAVARGHVAGFG